MDSVYRDFFFCVHSLCSFIEWKKNERQRRQQQIVFLFFYYHQLFFSYFPPFLIIIFFRLSLVRAQLTINTYVLLKSLFFSLFLSRSMCIFFFFFLSFPFLCSPHQSIDFVQLNEIKEKLCKKKFIYERMRELDKKYWIAPSETDSYSYMWYARSYTGTLVHSHTQCVSKVHLYGRCACVVVQL